MVAEHPKDAGGGRPQPGGGRVGQLGQGAVVGAAEVVPRQDRAGALLHPGATAVARAAAGAGEHQGGGVAAGWELAADGLDHLGGEGDLADAGVALGAGLEAAAELAAGLVAHVDDLEGGHGPVEVDPAAAQAGELADAQAGAEQGEDVIPPEQREAGQQLAGFLGSEGAALGRAAGPVRVGAALGAAAPCGPGWCRWRLRPRRTGGSQGQGAALATGWPGRPWRPGGACQRRTSAGLMRSMGRSPNQGRTWQPEPAFGDGQGGGAAVGVGRPQLPPVVGPAAERQPTAASSLPGAAAHLQALLGGQVAGLVGGVDGLGALGAVVQPPGDLVAVAALAPGHRAHRGLP